MLNPFQVSVRPWAQQTPSHWTKGHLCTITSLRATPSLPFWPSPFPCLCSVQAVTLCWEWPAEAGGGLRETRVLVQAGTLLGTCNAASSWPHSGWQGRASRNSPGVRGETTAWLTGSPEASPRHDTKWGFSTMYYTVTCAFQFTTFFSFSACNNHMSLPRWVTFLLFYKWGNCGFSDTARKGPTLDGNPDVVATSQWDVLRLAQRMRRASPSPGSYLLSSSKTIKGLTFKSLTLIYRLKWLLIYYKIWDFCLQRIRREL